MVGVKHNRQITAEEEASAAVEINRAEWNEAHTVDPLTIVDADINDVAIGKVTGHDKATHDALNIDADTLDGIDSTGFSTTAHNHNLNDLAEKSHASLTNVTADQHHAQAHTLASHSTKAHSELTGIGANDHHREWNWADEQPSRHEIYVPYSFTRGWIKDQKVLGAGSAGAWDDFCITHPEILKIDGTYYLYYTGRSSGVNWHDARIGLATSTDGINFTKNGGNPIVPLRAGDDANFFPGVVYDVYESDANKRWKMTCTGYTVAGVANLIVYYSADCVNWTFWKTPTQPTLFVNHPALFRIGNEFFVIYTNSNAINGVSLCVYDKDFTNIYNVGQIIAPGAGGTWDAGHCGEASLYWNLGVWYVSYRALDAANVIRIGMATSTSGFTWTKDPLNPVAEGLVVAWEGLIRGNLLMVEKDFYMYVDYQDLPEPNAIDGIYRYKLVS